MFTVKWIDKNGSEALWQGTDVTYWPGDSERSVPPSKPNVRFELGVGSVHGPLCGGLLGNNCSIDSGTVFVMNENGRTVAKYHLD